MRKKNEFFIYTCMWLGAVMILLVLFMQNLGDARIVNYSGIVRGATQKLVKEEMSGHPDDELILRLDKIIGNLKTGKGEFDLNLSKDQKYQQQLAILEEIWVRMKDEISKLRQGSSSTEALYELSQEHFDEADKMVLFSEQSSENKLYRFIAIYGVLLLLSVGVFKILNDYNNKTLEESMYTDRLTGLLNRAGFQSKASAILKQKAGNRYCLIEFDIDDFKFLNNSYGYEIGDKLLCALAEGLEKKYHTDQLCCRAAADDFFILAIQHGALLDDLRNLLSDILQQDTLLNLSEIITFTVGGYEIEENFEEIKSVMDKANIAHKNAKMLGKSATTWYNEKFLEKLNRENRMKNRFRQALDRGEFKMYLQPKHRLSDLQLHSAEALVRWEEPGEGTIPPDYFIPLFERNGQVAEIDFYMLDKACEYIRNYIDTYGREFTIAVNFSRVTIYQQRFYPTLKGIMDRYQIPNHCIEVEVTESAFNDISDVMIKRILHLKENGFIISMDDFGSGYSSLNLLDKLPIQVLKLDREFLREFGVTARAQNVINCVIELAHSLDIEVVCEGIEKLEHLEFLQKIGCDYGQGYYFSRPIPQEEFRQKYEVGKISEERL